MERTPEICCERCIWVDRFSKNQFYCHFYPPIVINEARFPLVKSKIHWCSRFQSNEDGRSALEIMRDNALGDTLDLGVKKHNGN